MDGLALTEMALQLDDGRMLHVYDTRPAGDIRLTIFWHHGTPNVGSPPAPLFAASTRLGIRWVSYDRPGYGGSTACPGRNVASGKYVARVADALGIERFAVVGHSGGGPHALACSALLRGRVLGVVSIAGLAPFDAEGLDWFAGMARSGVATLRAAADGRDARERHQREFGAAYDPEFTPADRAALNGPWSWLLGVVRPAVAAGPAAAIDDDLAYVAPWGFDPALVTAPTLFVHGELDRVVPSAHSRWLRIRCPSAELWPRPEDGHISVLSSAEAALDWLVSHTGGNG